MAVKFCDMQLIITQTIDFWKDNEALVINTGHKHHWGVNDAKKMCKIIIKLEDSDVNNVADYCCLSHYHNIMDLGWGLL